jgi:serine/threonine protein kinase
MIDKKSAIIKLVDFGLAIDQGRCQTDYTATRWYRAP